MTKSAVLLITYNRADFAESQLRLLLKEPSVSVIYVAVDGPKNTQLDQQKVTSVKNAIQKLIRSSSKKVHIHFSDTNLGCQKGVETAINWFFESEEQGIILEDDCKPDPTFFVYCAQLLEKYRDDDRIGMISGTRPIPNLKIEDSYFFSHHSMIWGWATWKRAWEAYQPTKSKGLHYLQDKTILNSVKQILTPAQISVIQKTLAGKIDTWDYIWYLTNILQSRYCILPQHNLVSNIGFLPDATHTKIKTVQSELPTMPLKFPLKHPSVILSNTHFDKEYLNQQQKWRVVLSALSAYSRNFSKKDIS